MQKAILDGDECFKSKDAIDSETEEVLDWISSHTVEQVGEHS